MLPVKKIRILMQKDYKQRKKLHIKKRQGVSYTAFSINASLTLEAALVLPVFLAALVAVVFFLQAIQVQSRLQQSLYNQVKKVSGYAYYMNIADMSEQVEQIMQAEYVKYAVINEIGRDYLENSVITGGSSGIHINFLVDAKKGILDAELDYSMDIPFNLLGFPSIRFSSRLRCHTWIGNTSGDKVQSSDVVYVTANGEVYHLYSDCSYLVSSIKKQSSPHSSTHEILYIVSSEGALLPLSIYAKKLGEISQISANFSWVRPLLFLLSFILFPILE